MSTCQTLRSSTGERDLASPLMTSRVHNLWTNDSSSCFGNEHIWHTGSSHAAALWIAKSDGTLTEPARTLFNA